LITEPLCNTHGIRERCDIQTETPPSASLPSPEYTTCERNARLCICVSVRVVVGRVQTRRI